MSHPARVLAAAVCGALATAPLALSAQSPLLFEGFAARRSESSAPVFGGLALSGYRGPFGLRVSGALNVADGANATSGTATTPSTVCTRGGRCRQVGAFATGQNDSWLNVGAWTADADLVVEPLRAVPALQSLLLGFSPYAFGGVGRYVVRPANAADTTVNGVSYGAGVRHQLVGALGVSAEARFRRAFQGDSTLASGALQRNTRWQNAQYRVGFTLGFGGRRRAAAGAAPAVLPPPVAAAPVAAAPAPYSGEAAPAVAPAPAAPVAAVAPRVLDLADSYVNTRFREGGASPADGFDGAGFVQYVFGRAGVALPRTAREIAAAGVAVPARAGALRPGDVLVFANDGSTPDHVALYAGRERIVHATASGGGVRYDVLGEGARGRWFADHLVGVRRVAADEAPARPAGDAAPPPGGAGR